jgi:neutral ceramidase
VAQATLEANHPQMIALFHAGCGADQNPIPRRTEELCEQYGKTLAASVDEVLSQELKPLLPALKTSFKLSDIGFEGEISRERLTEIAGQSQGFRRQWATRLIGLLDSGVPLQRSYSYPVQVWRLGTDQLWVSLGGEVVVDYALRFKKEYGPGIWVTGYANDVMAYIPSSRIQQEGGYESSAMDVYGLPGTGWVRDIEDRIASAVAECVREIRD